MQINSISGIGAPVPPGTEDPDVDVDPQPQDPIDEDTYISVAVEVLAWTLQESGHDL